MLDSAAETTESALSSGPHSTRSLRLRRPQAPRAKKPPCSRRCDSRAVHVKDPGDHRLSRECTIMGPAGLTAVFGMGTGVTPPVWSPENPPAGCHATPAAFPLDVRWS